MYNQAEGQWLTGVGKGTGNVRGRTWREEQNLIGKQIIALKFKEKYILKKGRTCDNYIKKSSVKHWKYM